MAENPTLTIRIPDDVKKLLDKAAADADQSLTDYVVRAIKLRIDAGCPRCGRDGNATAMQSPGMSEAFTKFMANANVRGKRVLILVESPRGGRHFFDGAITMNFSNESVVAISRRGDRPLIIPRRDVVGWYDQPALHNKMAMALTHSGWEGHVYDPE